MIAKQASAFGILWLVWTCASVNATEAQEAKVATLRCVNPVSKTIWVSNIDIERKTVDSSPATITNDTIEWHPATGGRYLFDRLSGDLNVTRPSSTGGFSLTHKCRWVQ